MRDPKIQEAADTAMAHFNGEAGFANKDKINLYVCKDASLAVRGGGCGRYTVTVDREPGVTPFMAACPFCDGSMASNFYRVPQDWAPDHEWYRPDQLTEDMSDWTVEHILKGGLVLRKIEGGLTDAEVEARDHSIRQAFYQAELRRAEEECAKRTMELKFRDEMTEFKAQPEVQLDRAKAPTARALYGKRK